MSGNKHFQVYQNNTVNTASGGELTMMLYNGCIKFIKKAMKDLDAKNYEGKNTNIQKAQAIIQELMLTLDKQYEITNQLLPLYDFIYYQLQQGNIKNDPGMLEEALNLVTEFRDTWKQVIQKDRQQKYTQGASI